jgi:hypothetical protein
MDELGVRIGRLLAAVSFAALVLASAGTEAKDKAKPPVVGSAKGKGPNGEELNPCGCYHDAKGACVCTDRKAKCECPGECEPVGCGEKRDKEIEKEMAAEIKRAQDDEKRRQAESEARENGTAPDAGEAPPPEAAKPAKPGRSKDAPAKADGKPEKKSP